MDNQNEGKVNSSQAPLPMDDRTLSIVAHIGGLLTSFVVPLIIFLIQKDKNSLAYQNAKEALNFQISVMIASFIATVLTIVLIGIILFPVIGIVDLIFCIMGAMAASDNKVYTYPLSIRLIK